MTKVPPVLTVTTRVNLRGNDGADRWAAQQGELKGVERHQSAVRYLNRALTVPLESPACL